MLAADLLRKPLNFAVRQSNTYDRTYLGGQTLQFASYQFDWVYLDFIVLVSSPMTTATAQAFPNIDFVKYRGNKEVLTSS